MFEEIWMQAFVILGDVTIILIVLLNLSILYYYIVTQNTLDSCFLTAIPNWKPECRTRVILVLAYNMVSFIILFLTVLVIHRNEGIQKFLHDYFYTNLLLTSCGLFASIVALNKLSYETNEYYAKCLFFIINTILQAPSLCVLDRDVLVDGAICAVMLTTMIFIVGIAADKEFYRKLLGPLSKLNGLVLAANICVSLIDKPMNLFEVFLFFFNVHIGLVLFSLMYIVNTQMFLLEANEISIRFDPLFVAVLMEISALNIFFRVATLVTINKDYQKLKT